MPGERRPLNNIGEALRKLALASRPLMNLVPLQREASSGIEQLSQFASRGGQSKLPGADFLELLANTLPAGAALGMAKNASQSASSLPKYVRRIEESGASSTWVDKPHGLYTTPTTVKSPHLDLGGKSTAYKVNPKARVLEIDATEWIDSPRRRGLATGQSGGVAVVRQLLGDAERKRMMYMSKSELAAELAKKYPKVEWSKYHDTTEMLEGYGGLLARERGYDAIYAIDRGAPQFSEFIGLTDQAFEAPIKRAIPTKK